MVAGLGRRGGVGEAGHNSMKRFWLRASGKQATSKIASTLSACKFSAAQPASHPCEGHELHSGHPRDSEF